jgi:hypothetical protein
VKKERKILARTKESLQRELLTNPKQQSQTYPEKQVNREKHFSHGF